MNTIHIESNSKWYVTRKPELQIDILSCMVLNGGLTKGDAENILQKRYHADILRAFKSLEKKNLIQIILAKTASLLTIQLLIL